MGKKKQIVFVATREPSYSRVAITLQQLREYYEVDAVVCDSKSYVRRMISVAWQLITGWVTGRFRWSDAVFVGFLAQPIFPLVRLLFRGPVISDAYFSLYDAMVNDKEKVKAKSLTGRLCYWLDHYMLKHSQLCLTDTQQHVEYMRDFFRVPNVDLRRLWISAESESIDWSRRSNGSKPYEVFFWGGFIPLQGVDTIVRAAAMLKEDNVRFTIFGAGQTYDDCLSLKRELSADNLEFKGWQSFDRIPEQARKSDLALGIFGTTEKASRVIPNKVYEAMGMGIPFVTRQSPASDELLEDKKHCLLIEPGSALQLAEAIRWARDHHVEMRAMADSSLALFRDSCSPACVRELMREAIDDCLAKFNRSVASDFLDSKSSVKPTIVDRSAVATREQ